MKLVIVFLVAVVVAIASAQYTTKFDSIDINQVIGNGRLLQNYIHCILGSGTCTTDAAELKKLLPDALETGCSKCSQKQRDGSRIMIKHLMNNYKPEWKLIIAKYDPNGIYQKNYLYLLD